jgi:hypothetical protein
MLLSTRLKESRLFVSEDSLAKVQFNPSIQKFQKKTIPIIIDHSYKKLGLLLF